MKATTLMAWLLPACLALAACGGSSGGSDLTPVQSKEEPPNFMSYPDPNAFVVGEPITPLVPIVAGGKPTNYLVEPELPAGLRLDAQGRILGTPTQTTAPATYMVTAGNSAGTTSFGVRITVFGRYTVGGTVSGLGGGNLVLTNNGADPITIDEDGPYLFPGRYVPGDNFDVAVATQPAGQTCTVTSGSGVFVNSDYHGAFVECMANSSKLSSGGGLLTLDDLARELGESQGEAQLVACLFPAATGEADFILTFGSGTYELRALTGAVTPTGCGRHLVTVDRDREHVFLLDMRTNLVSEFASL